MSEVMTHARMQYLFGTSAVEHVELVRAKRLSLPSGLRANGGVALLAVRTSNSFANPASSSLRGVESSNYPLIGADDTVIGPIGSFSARAFTYTPPTSDWSSVSERIDNSDAAQSLAACVEDS